MAARSLPFCTSAIACAMLCPCAPISAFAIASTPSDGVTAKAESADNAATIFCESALRSKSMTAIGTLDNLSDPGANNEPKNAATAIGAASVINSERLFEKNKTISLRTSATSTVNLAFMFVPRFN